jgi:polyhydroxybutyrate depolymerase
MRNGRTCRRPSYGIVLALGASVAVAAACADSEPGRTSRAPSGGNAGVSGAAGSAGFSATSGTGGAAGGGASGGAGGAGASGGAAGAGASGGAAGAGASGGAAGAGASGGAAGAGGNGAAGAGGARPDAGGGSPGCGLPVTAGTTKVTMDVAGVARTYLRVVPASLDANTPAPLILGFHGGSGTAEQASQYGLTGTEAALYVYPQALAFPAAGGVAWNVSPDGNDDEFIDALLIELGLKNCIDMARVFAAGQSNGAFFVNELGCKRPDAFRAIAPAAGGGPTGGCTKGVSAMVVHGTADTTVSIDKGQFSRDYWLRANGCAGASSGPADGLPCVRYSGCAKPVLWCEHAGAHSWPAFAGNAIRSFFLSQ